MKLAPRDIPALLKAPTMTAKKVLIFGKDEGLVRERADILSKKIVEDLTDPFNVVRLSQSQIDNHPGSVADELSAISMMGGARLVRLDQVKDSATKPIEICLEQESGDNVLIVTAGDLGPTSKLRKLFEKEKQLLSIACYSDGVREIEGLIYEVFGSHKLKANPSVVGFLKENLGNDRLVSRSELEKICLFKANDENRDVSLDEVQRLIGDSGALALFEIASAVTSGLPQVADSLIDRAIRQGESPVAILRTLESRLQRLYYIRGQMDEGVGLEAAFNKIFPRLHFKDKDAFKIQIPKWNINKISDALKACFEAEQQCKTTGLPDISICSRTCLSIAVRATRSV